MGSNCATQKSNEFSTKHIRTGRTKESTKLDTISCNIPENQLFPQA